MRSNFSFITPVAGVVESPAEPAGETIFLCEEGHLAHCLKGRSARERAGGIPEIASMSTERKVMVMSVAASLAVHLLLMLLAISLIRAGGLLPPVPLQASVPNEVVIFLPELLPVVPPEADPEKPKGPRFARTSEINRAESAPSAAAFESDKNTIAASEGVAAGEEELPSQEGVENLPVMELETRNWVDGEKSNDAPASAASAAGADATPPAAALAMLTPPSLPSPLLPRPEATVQPLEQGGENAVSPRESEAVVKSFSDALDTVEVPKAAEDKKRVEGEDLPAKKLEGVPEDSASEDAAEVAQISEVMPAEPMVQKQPSAGTPGFRPETHATSMRGTISNRGRASIDAAESPLGRYKAQVSSEIEKLWHRFRQDRAEFVVYGSIQLEFKVDRYGKPRNLKILRNDANAIMVDFSLSAILEANIPPMPEEILDILDNETLEVTYDVIIY